MLSFLDSVLDWSVVGGFSAIGYHVRKSQWDALEPGSMQGKTCVISGANAGLGFAAAKGLAALGSDLIIICRNPERGEEAQDSLKAIAGVGDVHLILADMGKPDQVREAVNQLRRLTETVDVLINNAGVLLNEKSFTGDIESTFAINTLGYFLLGNLCAPLIANAQGRIINVTSGGMYSAALDLDDPQFDRRAYDGPKAYAESKRAEMAFAQIWHRQLSEQGVFVAAMHPGWADTKAVRQSLPRFHRLTRVILRSPEQGADTIVWLAASPKLSLKQGGLLYCDRRPRTTDRLKSTRITESQQQKLWAYCNELAGTTWSYEKGPLGPS